MDESTPAVPAEPQGSGGPSRRNLLKAAAWSMPVVAIAAAVPAAAASAVTFALTITPPHLETTPGGTTTAAFAVSAADVPSGTATLGKTVTVILPSGFVFATGGPFDGNMWVYTTDGSTKSFTVRHTGTGAATGTIIVSSTQATSVSATINAIGFLGWGFNDQGQVGSPLGAVLSPRYMLDTYETTNVKVTGGAWAALLWADQVGRLWIRGTSGYTVASTPQRAETAAGAPLGANITYIARGTERQAGIAVDSDGKVWASGQTSAGFSAISYSQNGFWKEVANDLTFRANIPAGDKITQVEMMRDGQAMYLVQPSGRVLFSGNDSFGSAGQGAGGTFLGAPMKTGLNTPITGVVSIGTGFYMSAVVTAAGAVYTTGTDVNYGGSGGYYLAPKPLPGGRLAAKVVVAQTGLIVIDRDGLAWALGQNWFGSLGVGNSNNPNGNYGQVDLLDIKDVKYGNEGSLFLTTSGGGVYFAGISDAGQAGTGVNGGTFYTPNKVTALTRPASVIGIGWYDTSYAFIPG